MSACQIPIETRHCFKDCAGHRDDVRWVKPAGPAKKLYVVSSRTG
jgi:hypothetical protein